MSIDDFVDYAKQNSKPIPQDEVERFKLMEDTHGFVSQFLISVFKKLKEQNISQKYYSSFTEKVGEPIYGIKFKEKTLSFNFSLDYKKLFVYSNGTIIDTFEIQDKQYVSAQYNRKISEELLEKYLQHLMVEST